MEVIGEECIGGVKGRVDTLEPSACTNSQAIAELDEEDSFEKTVFSRQMEYLQRSGPRKAGTLS